MFAKNNIFLGVLGIAIIIGFSLYFLAENIRSEKKEVTQKENPEVTKTLAPEVESVLTKKTKLVKELLAHPVIVNKTHAANKKNGSLSQEEILALDSKWRNTAGVDDFIKSYLENDAAKILVEFQEIHPEFSEIFFTDEVGLNVAQTNKTTDIYQADESWWTDSYQNGTGFEYHGSIEFDESAQAEAISLYLPVRDPETGKAIGVAKAVVSIASIKIEL